MRIALVTSAMLLAAWLPAHATIGFSCDAEDAAAKFSVGGAYGTSLGSGLANFGADIEIRRNTVPPELRKLRLDRRDVSQHWFNGRELKLIARWERTEGEPFGEIVLTIQTRRGKAEESPYRGRYDLQINLPPVPPSSEQQRLIVRGAVTCGTG
jgi:hypothetical protein